jgi:hypothetical protein
MSGLLFILDYAMNKDCVHNSIDIHPVLASDFLRVWYILRGIAMAQSQY